GSGVGGNGRRHLDAGEQSRIGPVRQGCDYRAVTELGEREAQVVERRATAEHELAAVRVADGEAAGGVRPQLESRAVPTEPPRLGVVDRRRAAGLRHGPADVVE